MVNNIMCMLYIHVLSLDKKKFERYLLNTGTYLNTITK